MNSVEMAVIGAQALLGAISQTSDVQGFWLTADETAVIQIAPCESGSDQLARQCHRVRALVYFDRIRSGGILACEDWPGAHRKRATKGASAACG